MARAYVDENEIIVTDKPVLHIISDHNISFSRVHSTGFSSLQSVRDHRYGHMIDIYHQPITWCTLSTVDINICHLEM